MCLQNKLNLENQISYLPRIVAIDFLFSKLELTKHITPHANGEPLLKQNSSHSHFSPVLQ